MASIFFLLAPSLSIPLSLWLYLSRFPPLTPSVSLSLSLHANWIKYYAAMHAALD